jgi:hypothetical protein
MNTALPHSFPKRMILMAIIASLTACGGNETGTQATTPDAGGRGSAAKAGASAEEVAKEARGSVRCPPRIKTEARKGAPVDDIVGVRPGLTYEEAANLVMCTNNLMVIRNDTGRGFNIKTYGQTLRSGFSAGLAQPRIEKSSRQIMQEMQDEMIARGGNSVREDMKPGESKWYVGTMGLPQQEKVISVAREEWFGEGRNPTLDSVEQALLKKYGTPSRNQKSGGITFLTWTHDPLGRPVTETSPLANQCTAASDPDGGTNFSPDCGIVVAAQIVPMPDNPALARYLQVGIVDQAGGYDAITGTELALQQAETNRRTQQVQDAARNADAPKL